MDMTPLKDAIKRSASLGEILDRLAGAEVAALAPKDVTVIGRRLAKAAAAEGRTDIRIAYLANHTVNALADHVNVTLAAQGIVAAGLVGGYNQHFQDVLDPSSDLRAFDPRLIFLSLSLRELAPEVRDRFGQLAAAERKAELERIVAHLTDWAEAAKQQTGATLLIANFTAPITPEAGIADLKDAAGESAFYARLNLALTEAFLDDDRVYLFDLDRTAAAFGKARAHHPQLYYLARMEWHETLLTPIAIELSRYAGALLGRTRKCLVVDLDNTLWGGILGEDGWDGIRIGPDNAEGAAFAALQRSLLALKRRGIVLAINSKNNPEDVAEAFEKRPEMPLGLDDFAATEINWEHKHGNIVRIAERLNIGIDSLVFVDDNPAECALVEQMHPAVKVIRFDGDAARFAERLLAMPEFQKLRLTNEDRAKTKSYRDMAARAELATSATSLEDYLAGLKTEIVIRSPAAADAARVHQLFNKTNQFNLTTRRYGPAEVERFMAGEGCDLKVVDARDRFGELGTIALYLVRLGGGLPEIDSFLMSCRVMGREVETAIMNRLKHDYLLNGDHAALVGRFLPTAKNKPVVGFYDSQGFSLLKQHDSGAQEYRLEAGQAAPISCNHIAVSEED